MDRWLRRVTLVSSFVAGFACLASPSIQQKLDAIEGSSDVDKEWSYTDRELEYARAFEAEGDALAARGDAAGAMAAYLHAYSDVAIFSTPMAWTLERRKKKGYQVAAVVPGKRAAVAGLMAGDLITALDGFPLGKVDQGELAALLLQIDAAPLRPYDLTVERGGTTLRLAVNRFPALKFESDAARDGLRDGLEEKLLRFGAAHGTLPPVNDNMRWAAKWIMNELQAPANDDARRFALSDLRGLAYAAVGWSDLYLNCGLLFEAAGEALDADHCYRNFLLLRPDDPQAEMVRSKRVALAPAVGELRALRVWEGFWNQEINGRRQSSGQKLERRGRTIEVRNAEGLVWIRGTPAGPNRLSALFTFPAAQVPQFGGIIRRCFGDRLEMSGSLVLDADQRRFTQTLDHDFDIDPNTCAYRSNAPQVTRYVR